MDAEHLLNMEAPVWFAIPSFASVLLALTLAALLIHRGRPGTFYRALLGVLGTTALIHLANGLSMIDVGHTLAWRRLGFVGELAQAVAILYAGVMLIGSSEGSSSTAPRWRARAVGLLALSFGVLAWSDQIYQSKAAVSTEPWIALGSLGRVAYVFVLLALVLGVAQLEQLLRGMQEPLRLRLKFVLIGVGALGGYSIYQGSRLLLLPTWQPEFVLTAGLASLLSIGLIGYGLGKGRLTEIRGRIYVSPQLLYGSFTFIIIGLYLFSVGLIAQLVRYTGQPLSVALSSVVVFAACAGIITVLFSRRVRATLIRFISRHFYRSKYDYRTKWLELADAFHSAATVDAILDQFLQVLSRTFGASKISVWMRVEADGRFHQLQSLTTEPIPPPLERDHPVLLWLEKADEPVDVEESWGAGTESESATYQSFRKVTDATLCVPLRSDGELLAFVVLSRESRKATYGVDDRDLLKVLGHHVGVLLAHARLSEERQGAVQLEALHRFSAFYLHDLKNLTARLSLVVQNAEVRGADPAFHHAAMRTVSATVRAMEALMSKLSRKIVESGTADKVDVQEVIAETLESINGTIQVPVETVGERLPPAVIPRDQLQQVLLNIILNARAACKEGGEIRITAEQVNGKVVVMVDDTGPGIPTAELRTLFQPLRTTKRDGLGIGLYQCRRILEVHRGRMWVESEVGRGTRVRMELPAAQAR